MRNLSKNVSEKISEKKIDCHPRILTALSRSFFLLDQTFRLQLASEPIRSRSIPDLSVDVRYSFPVNHNVFTFGTPLVLEDHALLHKLGIELYSLLAISDKSESSASQAKYDLVSLMYRRSKPGEATGVSVKDCSCILSIRQAMLILTSYLLSDPEESPSQLAAYLRTIFNTNDPFWAKIPGLALWCCAIGARFATPNDKTWYLMQFLRISHSWILDRWEESCEGICMAVNAMDRVKPLFEPGAY